jgi:hypothetical protein
MDIISQVDKKTRHEMEIEIFPYLRDHCFEGKAILPAVETLIILAKAAKGFYPQAEIFCLLQARFPRFLSIDTNANKQAVVLEISKDESGNINSALLTAVRAKTNKIRRMAEHAFVKFSQNTDYSLPASPFRDIEKLGGRCISVPAATIYRELVPFGEAYQNIAGDLSVSDQGALGYISGGSTQADDATLGSPFPFDAVMHMACVWGQRFTEIVPFPVGFEKRIICRQTKKGESYLGRVLPKDIGKQKLIFDAWIYDNDGVLCEAISSLEMRDVTGGRLRPPRWIKV